MTAYGQKVSSEILRVFSPFSAFRAESGAPCFFLSRAPQDLLLITRRYRQQAAVQLSGATVELQSQLSIKVEERWVDAPMEIWELRGFRVFAWGWWLTLQDGLSCVLFLGGGSKSEGLNDSFNLSSGWQFEICNRHTYYVSPFPNSQSWAKPNGILYPYRIFGPEICPKTVPAHSIAYCSRRQAVQCWSCAWTMRGTQCNGWQPCKQLHKRTKASEICCWMMCLC